MMITTDIDALGYNMSYMMLTNKPEPDTATFILDSGATDHIIGRSEIARNFTKLKVPIKIYTAQKKRYIKAGVPRS